MGASAAIARRGRRNGGRRGEARRRDGRRGEGPRGGQQGATGRARRAAREAPAAARRASGATCGVAGGGEWPALPRRGELLVVTERWRDACGDILGCPAAIRQRQCRTRSPGLARVGSCVRATTTCSFLRGPLRSRGATSAVCRRGPGLDGWRPRQNPVAAQHAQSRPVGCDPPGEARLARVQDSGTMCAGAAYQARVGGTAAVCSVVCGLGGSTLLVAQGCPRAPRRGAAAQVVGVRDVHCLAACDRSCADRGGPRGRRPGPESE
jgi:hypothetical protein